MCVIAICETTRPTEDQVGRMWDQNSHGGGVAWREMDEAKGRKVVRWRKGLSEAEMKEFAQSLPFPYVMHFRIASIGGQRASLTHPFAVDDFEASHDLDGSTDGTIVFHNGHWSEWHHELLACAGYNKEMVPRGPWSDSRAMAWLFRFYGQGFLDTLLPQKTVAFSPTKLEVTIGDGWSKIGDIWFSNTHWERRASTIPYNGPWSMCKHGNCTVKQGLDKDGFCPLHPKESTTTTQLAPRQITGPVGVAQPETPFDLREELMQAELAWSLQQAGAINKEEAREVCSKSRLKNLRKQALKLRERGSKVPTVGTTTKTQITH